MGIQGIILAGGRSRRMGTNKALLPLDGRTVIEGILREMSKSCEHQVIVSSEQEIYRFAAVPVIPDLVQDGGPLAGLHAALLYSEQEWNLVCSCDQPFACHALFEVLLQAAEQADETVQAIIPLYKGRVQPLVAVYRKSSAGLLEQSLRLRQLRVMDWVRKLTVQYVHMEDIGLRPGLNPEQALFNMNTPEDYEAALRMAQEQR
ncbi:molybdenum cofactor guanylyltransferase [Paenibacillus caui]|uniref:molybdenum cofactor guanylyltransferase n=1 Tax=Paenibacillus caui TaxID=2873927 RepID=UPI001CA90985|nr:molybdenum cofactor guanylyltransferase [Paenibacillus caui]